MDLFRDPYPPAPPPGQDELPWEDGQPMDTPRHRAQMNLLIDSLTRAWADRDDYYVGGDMFVYFSELQSKGAHFRGPDFFVVLDTDRHKIRKSWVAWQENGRLPDVVIELTSPSTEDIDRGEKKKVYERVWRTGHYVLFDPYTMTLEAFELVRGRYVPLVADANGRIPIASMKLSLGVGPGTYLQESGTWLRLFDADGNVLLTDGEGERADAATARAEADAAKAEADAAKAEADAAKAEADAAKAEADAAKARVAELEAALARR